jgi:hypothetical protein
MLAVRERGSDWEGVCGIGGGATTEAICSRSIFLMKLSHRRF